AREMQGPRPNMNIVEIIQDALRRRPPRRAVRPYRRVDHSPPEARLKNEVWPLLREARAALEARGYIAIAVRPSPDDAAHLYALLILEAASQKLDDGCFLRFMILDGKVHVKVSNPARKDEQPVPLEPQG